MAMPTGGNAASSGAGRPVCEARGSWEEPPRQAEQQAAGGAVFCGIPLDAHREPARGDAASAHRVQQPARLVGAMSKEIVDSLQRLVAVQRDELARLRTAREAEPELQRQIKLLTVRASKAEQEKSLLLRRFEEAKAAREQLQRELSGIEARHSEIIDEIRAQNKHELLATLDETQRAQLAQQMLIREAEEEREAAKNEELKLQQRLHEKALRDQRVSHERELATLRAQKEAADMARERSEQVTREQRQAAEGLQLRLDCLQQRADRLQRILEQQRARRVDSSPFPISSSASSSHIASPRAVTTGGTAGGAAAYVSPTYGTEATLSSSHAYQHSRGHGSSAMCAPRGLPPSAASTSVAAPPAQAEGVHQADDEGLVGLLGSWLGQLGRRSPTGLEVGDTMVLRRPRPQRSARGQHSWPDHNSSYEGAGGELDARGDVAAAGGGLREPDERPAAINDAEAAARDESGEEQEGEDQTYDAGDEAGWEEEQRDAKDDADEETQQAIEEGSCNAVEALSFEGGEEEDDGGEEEEEDLSEDEEELAASIRRAMRAPHDVQ